MPESAVVEVPTTSTPAPASPTSGTPASAPATSATATTPTTPTASERPTDAKSLSAFLQKQDKAADATTPQAPLVTDSAAAAITPLTTAPATGVPDPNASKGPIPFDVHHTALANARTNAVTEYKKELGPIANYNPDQRNWLIDMATRMKDPIAAHQWLGELIANDPNYGPKFRPAQPAARKPDPDVQIHDAAGNIVGMSYSADRQAALLKWEREQLTGEFTKLVQPLLSDRDQRIAREKQDELQKDRERVADETVAQVNKVLRLDTLPKDEQQVLIAKFTDEHRRTGNAVEAALAVFDQHIRPGLEKKGQEKALETNRQKAAANTANGSGPASTSTRPTNQKELAKWMAANDGR